mmetsp:Transcript_72378/g.117409  ORF Transcript_72378/g.117409 Transcript_72378/m.117409 type:complete len:236 (-) Transcript_72378:2052-2759(-)
MPVSGPQSWQSAPLPVRVSDPPLSLSVCARQNDCSPDKPTPPPPAPGACCSNTTPCRVSSSSCPVAKLTASNESLSPPRISRRALSSVRTTVNGPHLPAAPKSASSVVGASAATAAIAVATENCSCPMQKPFSAHVSSRINDTESFKKTSCPTANEAIPNSDTVVTAWPPCGAAAGSTCSSPCCTTQPSHSNTHDQQRCSESNAAKSWRLVKVRPHSTEPEVPRAPSNLAATPIG